MVEPSDDAAKDLMSTIFSARPGEVLRPRATAAVFEVLEGTDRGRRFEVDLRTRRPITCGRGHGNDVMLTDGSVSNAHFEVSLGSDNVIIRDLGSRNGLSADGIAFERGVMLDGAEFCAGRCRIRFRLEQVAEVAASTAERCGAILGRSPVMRELFALVDRVAKTKLNVIVHGETGTGKELVSRAVHDKSPRCAGPYVVLDCGAIPRELAESTLFGHRKGGFTGAIADHAGVFVQAHGGTLLLDEIGELPSELQAKLLRALEAREVLPVGGAKPIPVDVRLVAASHRNLRSMVAEGKFRLDLFTRLAVFELLVPPLRERRDDIPLLAAAFLERVAAELERDLRFSDEALAALGTPAWVGNVRELKNVVERTAHLCDGHVIGPRDIVGLPGAPEPAGSSDGAALIDRSLKELVDDIEGRYCRMAMARFNGNVAAAARHAGYSRKGFDAMLARLGLARTTAGDGGDQ